MDIAAARALVGQTVTLRWRGGAPHEVTVNHLSSDGRYLVSWGPSGWHHTEIERAEVVEDEKGEEG